MLLNNWLKPQDITLAGVAQWIERQPGTRGLANLIPGRARAWVVGQVPSEGVCERQPTDVSLVHRCFFPSLPPFPSL